VADVLQPAPDTRVAPRRVLLRHPDDECDDVRLGARATEASLLRAVVLVGDEASVPAQDRIGCHDPGNVGQAPSAENVTFHGEPASLVVGAANALGAVRRTKDAILFQQIINDLLLLSIDPAGDEKREKGKRGWRRIHWESLPESWVGSTNGVWTFACAKIHQGTVYADVGVFRRFLEALAEFSHRTGSIIDPARAGSKTFWQATR
jgi:hypothetical protein